MCMYECLCAHMHFHSNLETAGETGPALGCVWVPKSFAESAVPGQVVSCGLPDFHTNIPGEGGGHALGLFSPPSWLKGLIMKGSVPFLHCGVGSLKASRVQSHQASLTSVLFLTWLKYSLFLECLCLSCPSCHSRLNALACFPLLFSPSSHGKVHAPAGVAEKLSPCVHRYMVLT